MMRGVKDERGYLVDCTYIGKKMEEVNKKKESKQTPLFDAINSEEGV